MRASERIARIADDGSGDLLLAIGLSALFVISLAAQDLLRGADNLLQAACAVGVFCCLIPRRADPQLSAIAATILVAVSALGSLSTIPGALGNLIVIPIFLLAYSLGTAADQRRSMVIVLLLVVGLQLQNGLTRFNPIFFVLTVGPWALGRVVLSRRRVTEQLALRGREPADTEIGRPLDPLDATGEQHGTDGLRPIADLVSRAAAAGLAVSCRFSGSADGLPAPVAETAYRVVQESLTNALRHAPGAPVDVVVAGADGYVEIDVRNGPAVGPPAGLERSASGRGLTGMRERVEACGGELDAGPAEPGGWRVTARLPWSG